MSGLRSPFLALAATAALVLGGCSSDEKQAEDAIEEAAEDAGEDVEVDVDGDDITIENSEGTVTMGGDLPEGFPEDDIPLVDGTVIMGIGATGQGYQITIQVDSDVADAVDEASGLLEDAGFTLDESGSYGDLETATLSSDAYGVVLSGASAEEGATLSYSIEIK